MTQIRSRALNIDNIGWLHTFKTVTQQGSGGYFETNDHVYYVNVNS